MKKLFTFFLCASLVIIMGCNKHKSTSANQWTINGTTYNVTNDDGGGGVGIEFWSGNHNTCVVSWRNGIPTSNGSYPIDANAVSDIQVHVNMANSPYTYASRVTDQFAQVTLSSNNKLTISFPTIKLYAISPGTDSLTFSANLMEQ